MADPATPGVQTSEYKLSKAVVIVSSVVSVLGIVLTGLSTLAPLFPQNSTVGAVLGVVLSVGGATVAALKAWAYEIQRTALKAEVVSSGGTPRPADQAAANLGS